MGTLPDVDGAYIADPHHRLLVVSHHDLDPHTLRQILPAADSDDVHRLATSTPPTSIEHQWNRLRLLLTTNLRVEYVGASAEDVAVAEDATCPWPAEVRELYRHVADADDRRGMLLLPPGFELLSLERVVQVHALWQRLAREQMHEAGDDIAEEMAQPAGSPTAVMLPGFIPFARRDADTLFVDTRHGPLHASVNLWPDQDWVHRLPLWRSLSAMLDNLASCLERNAPMAMRMSEWARYQPYVEDDQLVWEPVPERCRPHSETSS